MPKRLAHSHICFDVGHIWAAAAAVVAAYLIVAYLSVSKHLRN